MNTLFVPPAPFTETEWQELEYECLTDHMSPQLISETSKDKDTLLQEPVWLDLHVRVWYEFETLSELYNEMIEHQQSMVYADEWENISDNITFGDNDPFSAQDYLHLWDEHEMLYDMDAFESDMNAQNILAPKHQHIPQITMDVNISTKGANYATGESIVGKVYIPKQMTRFFKGQTKQCVIVYNGCEDARKAANIRMPWKCIFVNP